MRNATRLRSINLRCGDNCRLPVGELTASATANSLCVIERERVSWHSGQVFWLRVDFGLRLHRLPGEGTIYAGEITSFILNNCASFAHKVGMLIR